jgi:hypothetical protein
MFTQIRPWRKFSDNAKDPVLDDNNYRPRGARGAFRKTQTPAGNTRSHICETYCVNDAAASILESTNKCITKEIHAYSISRTKAS